MTEHTVKKIIEHIGSDAISARLGVTEYSVRHAKASRRFPASWYHEVEQMCREIGIPCPRSAFNFKTQAGTPTEAAE